MSSDKSVLIASDHAGVELKAQLIKRLSAWEWVDLGPLDSSRVDYPDYAEKLTERIASGQARRGILICGSGIGMSIAANKVKGIRAALVENPIAARLSREHNDSNVLCLGSRFVAPEYGSEIAEEWLKAEFSQDARHQGRLKKITAIEGKN
ncbi:MAG: ribose 5-phosphate isomerase B [Bdellovibrionia bacterium]